MIEPAVLSEFPEYKAAMQSSYDRRSVSPDSVNWFANWDGDGYIRHEDHDGRTEEVIFEAEGPGAITRIWMASPDTRGTLRFYFDGEADASVVLDGFDIRKFNCPELEPNILRHHSEEDRPYDGSISFLPIPYASSLKITQEEPSDFGNVPRYYQINYRTYPKSVKVRSFTMDELQKELQMFSKTNAALGHGFAPEGKKQNVSLDIAPAGTCSIDLPKGSRAVTDLELETAAAPDSLCLELVFDGTTTANVPVSEFFGYVKPGRTEKSFYMENVGGSRYESKWHMPYRKEASVILRNNGNSPVEVNVSFVTRRHKWGPNTLYFHSAFQARQEYMFSAEWAKYNNDYVVPEGWRLTEWDFAHLTGRGVYVGDKLSVWNHTDAWFGEGDEKISVDDDCFPSFFGTGLEDYYNTSLAPIPPFQTPFGCIEDDVFIRTRNLDAVPYSKKLDFFLEMEPWKDGLVGLSNVIYWYSEN